MSNNEEIIYSILYTIEDNTEEREFYDPDKRENVDVVILQRHVNKKDLAISIFNMLFNKDYELENN